MIESGEETLIGVSFDPVSSFVDDLYTLFGQISERCCSKIDNFLIVFFCGDEMTLDASETEASSLSSYVRAG